MTESAAKLLWDAHDAAVAIVEWTTGMGREGFVGDRMRRRAIEREITILGEALAAVRRDAPELAERIPGLAQAVGLRNRLAHDYGRIDEDRLWQAVSESVPSMLGGLAALRAELDQD